MSVGTAALRAAWNLRVLALFLLGPVVGVVLVSVVFGMPEGLIRIAAVVFLFSLATFGILVRGEWRRLMAPRRPPVG